MNDSSTHLTPTVTTPATTAPTVTAPTVSSGTANSGASEARLNGVLQFIKFCVVGSSNFVIDYCVAYVLTFHLHMRWEVAQVISFCAAVTNSFFWNSRWTFRALNVSDQKRQYAKFFAVNIAGLLVGMAIMKTVFMVFASSHHDPTPTEWIVAKLCSTAIVVFWNFLVNKHWTFKKA
jgi:putative flippase GtrA